MQQLERGEIGLDHAVARLRPLVAPAPAPAPAPASLHPVAGRPTTEAKPHSSVAGKVQLPDPSTVHADPPPGATRTGRVVLPPLAGRATPVQPSPPPPRPPPPEAAQSGQRPSADAAITAPAIQRDQAVWLEIAAPGVAVVTMDDHEQRNMFSPDLVEGLGQVFARIARDAQLRVVVIRGSGPWFCCGGTPASLEAIRRGEQSFTDTTVFRTLLDCEIPTIAAMNGHALGGGFAFGLYADLVLLGESSIYSGSFLEHGVTPGVGATFVFPHKLGPVLGPELLYTAHGYRGSELRDRGVPLPVHSAPQLLPRAMELAAQIADKPRLHLRSLKRLLARPIRRGVAGAIDEELATHRMLFDIAGGGER